VDSDKTGQLLIEYPALIRGATDNGAAHQPLIDFKTAYSLVRTEALYNTVTEFCIPTKLVTLINMCLNETYSEVWLGTLLCSVPHLTLCINLICAEIHQRFSNLNVF